MKLDKSMFDGSGIIEITNVRNISILKRSPSIIEVMFDESKTWNRVVTRIDGVVVGVNERFTFVNNLLKRRTEFDTIVDDEIREFELGL